MAVKFSRDTLAKTTGNKGDFLQGNRFTVEIEGLGNPGGIKRVSGLDHTNEMIEYQDADDHFKRKRAGRQRCGRLTLERHFASNREWFDWFKTVYDGKVQRKSISIVYLQDGGGEATRINLHECWPAKWKLHNLNSHSAGHISETIEVMYERIDFSAGK
jgi:phage tail-like protein